jgi:hypothetical protein
VAKKKFPAPAIHSAGITAKNKITFTKKLRTDLNGYFGAT